jgi:two-component system phosphate regulon sensor histidine kinase PhoR
VRDWLGRVIQIVLLAGFPSLLAGFAWNAAAGFALFGAIVLVLLATQFRYQAALMRWLAHPDLEHVPEASGTWEDVFSKLYRMVKREKQQQQGLTNALLRFREAGEAMPDGVTVLDEDDHIEWLNPMSERHFGITLKHDRRQSITNLLRQPSFVEYIAAQNYSEPLTLKVSSEPERVLSIQLVPYGDKQKLLLSRDITRWERIETMRRDFIANVSHELRTPLTVMKGFVETLIDNPASEPKLVARSLELMQEQAERMQRLVEDLLMLSRLEDTRNPLREDRIDVPALVQSLLVDAEHLNHGEHRLSSTVADAHLFGSREELRGAFSNLISNAIRYTPAGGDVQICWEVVDGRPVFRVRDNGEGIAPEHIPRLTERFYRVDRSRSRATGGTGLGLAIVKHVVHRHQAKLEIESEPGSGSTFSVVFPATRLAPAERPAAAAAKKQGDAQPA